MRQSASSGSPLVGRGHGLCRLIDPETRTRKQPTACKNARRVDLNSHAGRKSASREGDEDRPRRFTSVGKSPTVDQMAARTRSGSLAHPGHLKFVQAIWNQSVCQCLSVVKYPLFHLGSQFKSFLFNVSLTEHASCRGAPGRRAKSRITHPYPNLPIRGRSGPPRIPPVLRATTANEQRARRVDGVDW